MKAKPQRIAMKRIAKEKGLTCKNISQQIANSPAMDKKLSQTMVAWIEDGRFIPYDSQIRELAQILEVDADEMMQIEEEDPLNGLKDPIVLQSLWQNAQHYLKEEKPAYAALFLSAKVSYCEASRELRILFPADSEFSIEATKKYHVQEALRIAVSKAYATPVSFVIEKLKS